MCLQFYNTGFDQTGGKENRIIKIVNGMKKDHKWIRKIKACFCVLIILPFSRKKLDFIFGMKRDRIAKNWIMSKYLLMSLENLVRIESHFASKSLIVFFLNEFQPSNFY